VDLPFPLCAREIGRHSAGAIFPVDMLGTVIRKSFVPERAKKALRRRTHELCAGAHAG
jgi:hypothetical protein